MYIVFREKSLVDVSEMINNYMPRVYFCVLRAARKHGDFLVVDVKRENGFQKSLRIH